MPRTAKPLQINPEQKRELESLVAGPHKRLAERATIVLALAEEGMTHKGIAEQLGTSPPTVRRWRTGFENAGVAGLRDRTRSGAPKAKLVISEVQRSELERFMARPRTNRDLAFRARIVMACASGSSNLEVARQLRCSPQTVGKWRSRFIDDGVDGLLDEQRPGAPRKITDQEVEEVITQTLESLPKGRTHWSTRKMAQKAEISHSTVGRIWRCFGLQPHVTETFKISTDPLFVEKLRDIVGLYMNPPDHAVVLAFDEKPQIQALERAQPILPMDFGQPERQTQNYFRHGHLDLFAALNVASGEVIARTKKRHRSKDFIEFLRHIDEQIEAKLDIHVVLDNLSAHKSATVKRWLARNPRFHFHYTPTYSSWLNLVERFFGLLTEQALKRGSHTSVNQLKCAIEEYIEAHNEEGRPFVWTKTADQILDKVKRFGQRTLKVHDTESE